MLQNILHKLFNHNDHERKEGCENSYEENDQCFFIVFINEVGRVIHP